MTPFPTDEHQIIYRHVAIAAGFTDADLGRACRRGDIVSLVRGAYVHAAEREPDEHHRLEVIASHRLGRFGKSIPSHQSAAALHRLPMLKPNFRRLHTITGHTAGGGRTSTRHDHVGVVAPEERTEVDGIVVPIIERVAVDVACTTTMGFAGALAVFDAALRAGADRQKMEKMLRGRRLGVNTARRALRWADGTAESPGESWSRAQMIEAGLLLPRLQHTFVNDEGKEVARTDFDWDGLLVGEFDGKVKYQKHLRPGEKPSDAVIREKQREDRLRAMGIMVVRWLWTDLENGTVVGLVRRWLVHFSLMAA
ncbi:hypothetical protein ABLE92_09810 [Gordonia sp. VNQ95]|uniref:hypothetical protein n=1 Tax=Gordonia TaxID=2053 RepID=UPI0032B327CF